MIEAPARVDLLRMLAALGWPSWTLFGRSVGGEAGWCGMIAPWSPPTPSERRAIARHLGRHLLCLTPEGRRRLRRWLDMQRGTPRAPETLPARRDRVTRSLRYFGDVELFPLTVAVLAALPRPVTDHVLSDCMVITSGASTRGWTCGRFPPLLPIVLAGHSSAAEIARTLRHEVAHRWLIDHDLPARTQTESDDAMRALTREGGVPADVITAVFRQGEDEADWLAASWE